MHFMDSVDFVDPKSPEHVTILHDPGRFYSRANERGGFATG
jgi:hypothetical protein